MERVKMEIKRRICVARIFPNEASPAAFDQRATEGNRQIRGNWEDLPQHAIRRRALTRKRIKHDLTGKTLRFPVI